MGTNVPHPSSQATLSATELQFGDVEVNTPVSRTIELQNIGGCVMEYLVASYGNTAIDQSCIMVDPCKSIVFPGLLQCRMWVKLIRVSLVGMGVGVVCQ